MKTYPRIRVIFPHESLLDFQEVVRHIKKVYGIGYAALFYDCGKTSLVLQTLPRKAYMAPRKVAKICGEYADDVEVAPLTNSWIPPSDQLLEVQGRFRRRGGFRAIRKKTSRTSSKTIYLYTNALGDEDMSHITANDIDRLIGSEDVVVDFFEKNYSSTVKKRIMMGEWTNFRRYSRNKIRRWDEQEKQDMCQQLGIESGEEYFSDSDSDADSESSDSYIARRPTYDPNSDSEGNLERKRKLFRDKIIKSAPRIRKDDFLREFEVLLLENPHNSNVIASTKDRYFKYFDGERWTKSRNNEFFDKVTLARIRKADEILKSVQLSDFTRLQLTSMVRILLELGQGSEVDRFLRDNTDAVKDGILAAANQNLRLEAAERVLRKQIVRVGLNVSKDVVRNSSWDKLLGSDLG